MEANTHRRGVIKREQVRVDRPTEGRRAASSTAREAAGAATPHVRLLRLEDGTQALEFTCSCGEVSLIEIRTENEP